MAAEQHNSPRDPGGSGFLLDSVWDGQIHTVKYGFCSSLKAIFSIYDHL